MVDKKILNDFEEQQAINKIVNQGLQGRKKQSTLRRALIAVVVTLVFGVPLFGITFPALAQHIPLIGGLFAQMDSAGMGGNLNTIADYATMIDETQDVNGVSITLVEQFFNGREIYLTYLVESEVVLNHDLQWFEYALTREIMITIDNEVLPIDDPGWMPYTFWIDDYSFFFMLNIPLFETWEPISEIVENAATIDVNLTILEFGINNWNYIDDILEVDAIVTGPWEFRLSIERSELMMHPVNEWIDYGVVRYGIISLAVTPNQFIIEYSGTVDFDQLIFASTEVTLDSDDLWRLAIDVQSVESIFTIDWQIFDNNDIELKLLRHDQNYIKFSASGSLHLINDGLQREQLVVIPIAYEWLAKTENGMLEIGELLSRTELKPIVIKLP